MLFSVWVGSLLVTSASYSDAQDIFTPWTHCVQQCGSAMREDLSDEDVNRLDSVRKQIWAAGYTGFFIGGSWGLGNCIIYKAGGLHTSQVENVPMHSVENTFCSDSWERQDSPSSTQSQCPCTFSAFLRNRKRK